MTAFRHLKFLTKYQYCIAWIDFVPGDASFDSKGKTTSTAGTGISHLALARPDRPALRTSEASAVC
ncbi:hypothetical protein [Massilia sp. 9096]|uniref:hypothetical protein n=1 Tax=Massilia sp. 9096 TaxID=1500894 RepID=UPI0018CEE0C6|nr:hypothetical protein [Massilia sp. 9096]